MLGTEQSRHMYINVCIRTFHLLLLEAEMTAVKRNTLMLCNTQHYRISTQKERLRDNSDYFVQLALKVLHSYSTGYTFLSVRSNTFFCDTEM